MPPKGLKIQVDCKEESKQAFLNVRSRELVDFSVVMGSLLTNRLMVGKESSL